MDKPKRKNPYTRHLLTCPDFGTRVVKESDTLLPSERCFFPVDVDWLENDIVDKDELVYACAYGI